MPFSLLYSSKVYRSTKDGSAIWIKIKAGIKVQIHSKIWPSNKDLWIILLIKILNKITPTNLKIKSKIILVKSWKYINSSITGEKASCRLNCDHVDISEKQFKFTKFVFLLNYTS